ncbi:ribonuclease H-like domain-containing protein [Xylaria cf. heliscus]|nr:ribonuclease H-like domain-containing protein [Xylaria cf. heliscus]
MADNPNRGRGGQRGRGRGRGRGDFEGQGQGRGATFSGIHGHNDAPRGGRGRGRGGDYGPGRGQGGGFEPGRGRGRPGGYSGGGKPDRFPGEEMIFNSTAIPRPDPAIEKLENSIIKGQGPAALTSKMAQVQISTTHPAKEIWFPRRPAFTDLGNEVTLWTNYFKLDMSAKKALLKYSLKVKRKDKYPPKDEKSPTKDQKKATKADGPKGRKLHRIVESALNQVAQSVPFATEFKDKVISLEPFVLPENQIVTVSYHDEGKDDVYEVKFDGPSAVDLPGLLNYLRTMRDPSGDSSFPKFADAIDAITIITGYYARSNSATSALGRSRYFPLTLSGEQGDLGWPEHNRIIRGYFQSARIATGRLILNANVAHGVFRPKGFVSDLTRLYKNRNDATDYQALNKVLSKLRAQCRILSDDKSKKDRYIQKVICGLADRSDGTGKTRPTVPQLGARARDVKFYLRAPAPAGFQANALCSVADYYKKRYGYTVDPNYPVVNVGTKVKPVYMPAEFVEVIDGQPVRRKTTPDETRNMISFSCRSPFANATSISTYGRQVLGLDNSQSLSRFGIQVGKALLTVQGRELPPPVIVYTDAKQPKSSKLVQVREGEWNMENVRVVKPGKRIERWFCISIDEGYQAPDKHDQVLSGMKKWVNFLQSQGIDIASTPLGGTVTHVTVTQSPTEAIKPTFLKMQQHNPQLVFVVLPGKKTDTRIYNEVKKLCHIDFGYQSQAVLAANLVKQNLQIFANLGLKINLKMGGVNHRLGNGVTIVKQKPTMIVGYDVTHPTNLAGNSRGVPSLAGMVASVDSDLGQWPGTAWAQSARQEMLDNTLEERFAQRLRLFQKHSNRLPENIIIFRDGVSEGQYEQVLQVELPMIREACKKIYPATQRAKISLIVSVKRHQTRFYPTNERNTVKSRNIKNGTVVDRGVTQAPFWDYYLTAHKGLQGTSRPAHYTVLIDEVFEASAGSLAANQLINLTFELCHLFGRATKAVSICPPAYYADILCTCHRVLYADYFENSDTMSIMSGATEDTSNIPARVVHENLRDTMYYL